MSIFDNLRQARENAGFKQVDVARILSFSNKSISNWETGRALPNLEDAIKLADLYNVPLDHLVGRNFRNLNRIILTPKENTLITNLRILSNNGKQKVFEYVNDLASIPAYTQQDSSHKNGLND